MKQNKKILLIAISGWLLPFAFGCLPAEAQSLAYVANEGSNNVSVINTSTNTVVATVAVGGLPEGVAITPDGAFAYVSTDGPGVVWVINTSTNTVVTTVPVGAFPMRVAITPSACREDDGEDVEGEGDKRGDDGHEGRVREGEGDKRGDGRHEKRKRPCKRTGDMDFEKEHRDH